MTQERVAKFGIDMAVLKDTLGIPKDTIVISAEVDNYGVIWLKVGHPDLPLADFHNPPIIMPQREVVKWDWNADR